MTRILVIEDAKDLRDDVVEMLSLEGFDATGAENGLEGVKVARQLFPDLIVCDIMMPEMDGYGVLEELRSTPDTATIPFIFLTAKTDRVDMRHGMVLGADDYLTKPFRVSELLDSIRVRLDKRAELNAIAEKRMENLRENIITALPHELRTPLNTIIGFSEMLMVESPNLKPDLIADWANHINTAAHRLYRLVENYLFYARLEVARTGNETSIDIDGAKMANPQPMIEMHIFQKGEQYHRHDDIETKLVDADTLKIMDVHFTKVIEELLDNALKFSDEGSKIIIESFIVDKYYVLKVTDHGHGMKQEDIESIGAYMQFQRWFFEQQGMGLGLVIVRSLLNLYHGELSLQSKENEGTSVEVKFLLDT